MKKVVTILGARPQFVKAAVLSRIIMSNNELEEIIVHTGQHYDVNMSEVFFTEMNIPKPKYNLNINGLSHAKMTGEMMVGIEQVLIHEQPDAVLVYGDTNSTLAGALAAKKLQIKVVHIEAGLRSFNKAMPEEINRIATDSVSDLLLCPTDTAVQHLKSEGVEHAGAKIVQCGDIMKDAVQYHRKISAENSKIISNLNLNKTPFILSTIHRQENTDDLEKLIAIFNGLEEIGTMVRVILPLHPRTKKIIEKNQLQFDNIEIINPVGYIDMLELLQNSLMVITDSGGLQKEAFFNEKHCIIARTETEWVELVQHDFAKIVGSDTKKMIAAFHYFKDKSSDFSINLFGDRVGESIYQETVKLICKI